MHCALDGARLKVARAEEHLRALEHEITRYLDTQPYEFINTWPDGRRVPAIQVRVPPPSHLSTVVGDCLSNLRSSLELTFWALLRHVPLSPDESHRTAPLIDSSDLELAIDAAALAITLGPEADRHHARQRLERIAPVAPWRLHHDLQSLLRASAREKTGATMRVLILSDIHANIDALQAVDTEVLHGQNRFDQIWVLGDLVDYGAAPACPFSPR